MAPQQRQHIIIFPLMAQGHVIPALSLALHLESRGHEVSIVTTSNNAPSICHTLSKLSHNTSAIRLLILPFDSTDHGLSPGTENTDNLPPHLMFCLIQSTLSLKPHFKTLLASQLPQNSNKPRQRPPLIISDMFFTWTAEIAAELQLRHIIFCMTTGFGMACLYSTWMHLPHWNKTLNGSFILPDFEEAGRIHLTQLPQSVLAASESDAWTIFQRARLPEWYRTDGVIFNTVEELDPIGLGFFRRKIGCPVWAIGPVHLLGSSHLAKENVVQPGIVYEQWLNGKPDGSVLYISFGSQATLSVPQMKELAQALEMSGKYFIWVVRSPFGFEEEAGFDKDNWFPSGFINRIEDDKKGLIIKNWAPQKEILSHKSVGAFLTHCGWNSVIEALTNGVPLLGWPMAADQFFIAKFVEEQVGVCIEVARGVKCDINHKDLMKCIEKVMGKNERVEEIRKRASEVREMISYAIMDEKGFKGSSIKAMDEFINDEW